MIRSILVHSVLFVCAGFYAQEAGEPVVIGHTSALHSLILDQERPILVSLPDSYTKDSLRDYPVLYLLDGNSNFHHTTATVDFLAKNKRIPEMVVIGIPNTDDRSRDLTPPSSVDTVRFPTGGGADNMLAFIEKELIPFINSSYRTNDYKLLVGHSFGGLFATHAMINHPGIFNAYLAISPSLWWDNQKLVMEQTDAFFEEQTGLIGHYYMTMGNEDRTMLGGAWKLAALLEEKGPKNLSWHFDRMPTETHGSIPQRSTIKGLEFIFSQWNLSERSPLIEAGGISEIESYEAEVAEIYGFLPEWSEQTLMGYGLKSLDLGRPDLATPIFEKCTKAFPGSTAAWFNYGSSLHQMDKRELAVPALRKSLALKTSNMQAIALLKKLGEDVSGLLPDITLTQNQLNQYCAKYSMRSGENLKITCEGGYLIAEASILSKEKLIPVGEHRFFIISKNSTIEFIFEAENIVGVKANTPDGIFEGTRIK